MRVLFVDDEVAILEQAEIFLEKEDDRLNVDTALSAEEGLQKLSTNDYDAIVSDYQMPEMDGLEFLKILREEKGSEIPFIVFTGKGREKVAMKALNLGADRYLQKGGDPKSQYGVLADAVTQEIRHFQAEQRLRSSEKKYRDLTEKSLVGVYIIQDNEFKYVNPEFCEIFGYTRDELIGKNYLELVASEDKDLVKNGVEERQNGSGDHTRYTFKALANRGEEIIVEVFSVPTTYKDRSAVQGTITDITERVETREKLKSTVSMLKTLMNNQESGILFESDQREVLYANRKFCELFNVPGPEEIIGEDCRKAAEQSKDMFKHPVDFMERIEEIIEEQEPVKNEELQLKDGRLFKRDYAPIYVEDEYIGHLWQYRDVTARIES